MGIKWIRLSGLALCAAGLFLATGCMRNKYVVPNALTEEYSTQAPLTVGVLIRPDLRQQWFQWRSESQRQRIDVPVGKLTLDFARAGLRTAFEDFYIERFYDRRSQKGLLAIIERVDFDLDGYHVLLRMAIKIEDESQTVVWDKTYQARGRDASRPIIGIPFFSKKPQKVYEINTRAAFQQIYRELVDDILILVGLAEAPPPPEESVDDEADLSAAEPPDAEPPDAEPPADEPPAVEPPDVHVEAVDEAIDEPGAAEGVADEEAEYDGAQPLEEASPRRRWPWFWRRTESP